MRSGDPAPPVSSTANLAALGEQLTGSSPKGWFARCCDAVAAGPDATAHLGALLNDGGAEGKALIGVPGEFSRSRTSPSDNEPLSADEEDDLLADESTDISDVEADRHPHLATARVLATLAAALTEQRQTDSVARMLLEHADRSGTHSVGTQLLPAGTAVTTDPGPLSALVLALLQNTSPSRGYAVLCAMRMSGLQLQPTRHTEIRVLFRTIAGTARGGEVGTLRLTLLKSGPSGLHPDPTTMSFLQADDVFVSSLQAAWSTCEAAKTDACVIWSVRLQSGYPALSIVGNSLGAAVAVGLDDLAPKHAVSRFTRTKRIDRDCAVTAGLDDDKLTPVTGYREKVESAQQHGIRVVVARSALEDARGQSRGDYASKVTGAATVTEAIRETRSRPNYRLYAAAAAILLLIGAGTWGASSWADARHDSKVAQLSSTLISRSGELANSDSRAAALLALAADKLHPTAESRNAMLNIIQNNQAVVASTRAEETSPIFNVAASGDTMLTSGRTNTIKAWKMPKDGSGLVALQDISVDEVPRGMASVPSGHAFAVLDSRHIHIYQGAPNRAPVLVKTLDAPAEFRNDDGSHNVYGPIVDSESSAIIAIDENFHGMYWKPGMDEAQTFSLGRNSALKRPAEITAVSAFGALTSWYESRTNNSAPTSAAAPTTRSVLIATSQRQVLRLVVTDKDDDSKSFGLSDVVPGGDVPAPITAVAYGEGQHVLVGTENGIQLREIGNTLQTQFPYGGMTEYVHSMFYNIYSQNRMVVATPGGIRVVEQSGTTPLNNISSTASGESSGVVTSMAQTGDGLIAVGRIDGRAVVLDPDNRGLGLEDRYLSNIAVFGSGNQLLTTSSDGPRFSTSLSLSQVPAPPQSQPQTPHSYNMPTEGPQYTAPYVNAGAVSDEFVAASGRSNYTNKGQIWAWNRTTNDIVKTVSFSQPDAGNLDIVSDVAFAPTLHRLVAINPRKGELGIWSTQTWTQLDALDIGGPKQAYADIGGTFMTASSDGSKIAVSFYAGSEMHVYIFDVEQQKRTAALVFGEEYESAVLSPDGTKLAINTSQGITLHDLAGKPVSKTVDLKTEISDLQWSPDGARLAIALREARQIAFVDTTSMTQQGQPWTTANGIAPYEMTWSLDSQFLAMTTVTTTDNQSIPGRVQILRTQPPDYTQAMCTIAGYEDFDDSEWRDHAGDDIDRPTLCTR